MTESVKNIILRHKDALLSREVQQRHSLNERDIISAATLPELDEAYTRRVRIAYSPFKAIANILFMFFLLSLILSKNNKKIP